MGRGVDEIVSWDPPQAKSVRMFGEWEVGFSQTIKSDNHCLEPEISQVQGICFSREEGIWGKRKDFGDLPGYPAQDIGAGPFCPRGQAQPD